MDLGGRPERLGDHGAARLDRVGVGLGADVDRPDPRRIDAACAAERVPRRLDRHRDRVLVRGRHRLLAEHEPALVGRGVGAPDLGDLLDLDAVARDVGPVADDSDLHGSPSLWSAARRQRALGRDLVPVQDPARPEDEVRMHAEGGRDLLGRALGEVTAAAGIARGLLDQRGRPRPGPSRARAGEVPPPPPSPVPRPPAPPRSAPSAPPASPDTRVPHPPRTDARRGSPPRSRDRPCAGSRGRAGGGRCARSGRRARPERMRRSRRLPPVAWADRHDGALRSRGRTGHDGASLRITCAAEVEQRRSRQVLATLGSSREGVSRQRGSSCTDVQQRGAGRPFCQVPPIRDRGEGFTAVRAERRPSACRVPPSAAGAAGRVRPRPRPSPLTSRSTEAMREVFRGIQSSLQI